MTALWRRKLNGAEEIRTPNFQLAKLALYQLSYRPASAAVSLSGEGEGGAGAKCGIVGMLGRRVKAGHGRGDGSGVNSGEAQ